MVAFLDARPREAVADLVERQYGVISRRQLLAAGVSASGIQKWTAEGRLRRLHRGVYAYGHRKLTPDGFAMAAVLAGGPRAVLSHRSAADAWRLRRSARTRHEITIPGAGGVRSSTLDLHRCRLNASEITALDGIPITTPARTLLDLAEVVPRAQLDRALDESVRLGLYDGRAIDAVIAANPGRRGRKPLTAALADLRPDRAHTRSELERRALDLLDAHGLPRPQINALAAGYEADLLWPQHRLVVELDGHAFHSSPRAFERDRRRDADLRAAGYTVLRLTWRQLGTDPAWVVTRIGQLLA